MEAGIGDNEGKAADCKVDGLSYIEGWRGTKNRKHHLENVDGKKIGKADFHLRRPFRYEYVNQCYLFFLFAMLTEKQGTKKGCRAFHTTKRVFRTTFAEIFGGTLEIS